MERRTIKPADVSVKRIGHFGFFRPQFQSTLWREALAWLDARAFAEKPAQSQTA